MFEMVTRHSILSPFHGRSLGFCRAAWCDGAAGEAAGISVTSKNEAFVHVATARRKTGGGKKIKGISRPSKA